MIGSINTKDLEEKYQGYVSTIKNAVAKMIEGGILPIKFAVFTPGDLKTLHKVLNALDGDDIIWIFDEIEYAMEIIQLKSDLYAEGISDSDWVNGTVLCWSGDTDSLVEKAFSIPNDLAPFLDYDEMFEEIKDNYTLVEYRGCEYYIVK